MDLDEELRLARARLGNLEAILANREAVAEGRPWVGRVVDGGAMPTTVPRVFLVNPSRPTWSESDGASWSWPAIGAARVPTLILGPGVPGEGDEVLVFAERGGRFVGRLLGESVPPPPPPPPEDCCSVLPAANIPSNLSLATYFDDPDVPYDEETAIGPFVYVANEIQLAEASPLLDQIGFVSTGGYYVAGPFCLKSRLLVSFSVSGGTVTIDTISNRRHYLVLACTTAILPASGPLSALANEARVRLFVMSNAGQTAFTEDGAPTTCDDRSNPFWPDGWVYETPAVGQHTMVASGNYAVISSGPGPNDLWAPRGMLGSCDPLCYLVDATFPIIAPLPARLRGAIGETPCELAEPCLVTITLIENCPEDCPSDSVLWTLTAEDVVSEDTFGPRVVEWFRNGDGDCIAWRVTITVEVPIDGGTGDPISPRSFALTMNKGETPVSLGTVDIVDCEPVVVENGFSGNLVVVRYCVEGCPAGLPYPGITPSWRLLDSEGVGSIVSGGGGVTGSGGCGLFAFFAITSGAESFLLELTFPAQNGYAEKVQTFPVTLPAACSGGEIDLGTITLGPDEDHVCTCGGLVQKCLRWSGNGPTIDILYVEGSSPKRWIGTETLTSAREVGPGFACETTTGPTTLDVALIEDTSGDGCAWRATRDFYRCDNFSTICMVFESTNIFERLLSTDEGQEGNTEAGPDAITIWGPSDPMPSFTISSWGAGNDPELGSCAYPPEGVTPAGVALCNPPVGGGAPTEEELAATSEPALPTRLRMASQLVRATGDVVQHAARTGRVKATNVEQDRRWAICRACDHFRASDARCGKIDGCGCWLTKKIPLEASKCPINRWEQAPQSE